MIRISRIRQIDVLELLDQEGDALVAVAATARDKSSSPWVGKHWPKWSRVVS
jgi:hypothetical protein